jgi:WD40 repeat protein/serine/threonine protein kinase
MTETNSEQHPVDALAEDFVARYRRGERPSLTEYALRHPDLAEEIRELFPALAMMEDIRPSSEHLSGAAAPAAEGRKLERVGDYRILREVGRGGMGVVYEAEQESLGRHVAVKVLPPHALFDAKQVQRFQCEARAAARLHHTNIVPVYGVGEADGLHYYVMQFIQGQGLDQVLDELNRLRDLRNGTNDRPPADTQGAPAAQVAQALLTGRFSLGANAAPPEAEATMPQPAPLVVAPAASDSSTAVSLRGHAEQTKLSESGRGYWQSVARIGIQVAEALAHAHSQGILHRDIKPSNLLLDTHGSVWVTDFGLAKAADSDGLTQTGDLVGTLRYMAPERFQGKSDPRSDVYGLGVTLYELLTLRPAFQDADRNKLLSRIMHGEPPRPRRLNADVPRDLETIVLKAIAKEPRQRYATAAELAEDLHRFLADRPVKARRASPAEQVRRWCRRNPLAATLAALAAVALLAVAGLTVAFGLYYYHAAGALTTALDGEQAQRREADRLTANLIFDRGVALCEQGEIGLGLLWLVRSLQAAEQVADDSLARAVRCNLASWQGELHHLHGQLVHGSSVAAVAFSPDGRLAVTAGEDHMARLWEVATGQPFGPPLAHAAPVTAVAFSHDGHSLLTLSGGMATVWSTAPAGSLRFQIHDAAGTTTAAFSPDGARLLTAAEDGSVRFWATVTGQPLGPTLAHRARVNTVAFSPDGRLVLTGGADYRVRLWEVETGKERLPALGHEGEILAVAFSPDGKTILTGGDDDKARFWETATGRALSPPLAHSAGVRLVAFRPDGRVALTGARDWRIRLWDVATGRQLGPTMWHRAPLTQWALSPDGRTLLTGSWDGKACVWDLDTMSLLHAPMPHWGEVHAVAFSRDGRLLLTAGQEPAARLWRFAPRKEARPPFLKEGEIYSTAFSPDCRLVAFGGEKEVTVWDLASGRLAIPPLPHPFTVRGIAFGPEGKLLATGDQGGTVYLWELPAGRLRGRPLVQPAKVIALALSGDGKTLLVGMEGGTVALWDVETATALVMRQAHSGGVLAVAFSPDGRRFLTASNDHTARVWATATGEPLTPPLPHQGQVFAAAFRPDGKALLTAGDDRMACVWDAQTGQLQGQVMREQDMIRAAAFSPDGRLLLVSCWGGAVRLWDETTRKPISALLPHANAPLALTLSNDGRHLLTAGKDRSAQCWDMPIPLEGDVERIRLWLQLITGLELDANGAPHGLDAAAWSRYHEELEALGGPPGIQ